MLAIHEPMIRQVDLDSRGALVQFFAIYQEFGESIPWLKGLEELLFATDAEQFVLRLSDMTRQYAPLTVWQFILDDMPHTFLGGMLHFAKHPENFQDVRNVEIAERLTVSGSSYISCLQVREPHQGAGVGEKLMLHVLDEIREVYNSVWGVVSDFRLVPWYTRLGAQLKSPIENKDNLWIVWWPPPTFPKTTQ
jgi:GNAT superfamily N-acetyltransferase